MDMSPTVWQTASTGLTNQLLFMGVIFSIFYFIVFRPMRKRQKETETMLNELKNGDQILTSGGIFGTVVGIQDDRVQLRIADSVKIQISRSAVSQRIDAAAKSK